MTKFQMRCFPEEPIRCIFRNEINVNYSNFRELLDYINTLNIQYENIRIVHNYDGILFEYDELEPDKYFNLRLEQYTAQLKIYNKWVKDNKENIEKFRLEQKETQDRLKNNEIKAIQDRIEKEQKKLEKLLKSLPSKVEKNA